MLTRFRTFRLLMVVTILLVTVLPVGRTLLASANVDMVLVIALDVSASVDDEEFQHMREGLARAIVAPEVIAAVGSGHIGAIAVSVVQWSGFTEQDIKIKWTRLALPGHHLQIARKIRNMKRRYNDGATDLGGAITHASKLLLGAPYQTPRRVVDIAGDGTNNVNESPQYARGKAVSSGVVINALAINSTPGGLINYYRNFVIGGAGSFVENASDYYGFEEAMRRKLVREIGSPLLF